MGYRVERAMTSEIIIHQDDGPDGGKFISGQSPKPMKRPHGYCDDDSHFIVSLTSANLKKYAIRAHLYDAAVLIYPIRLVYRLIG